MFQRLWATSEKSVRMCQKVWQPSKNMLLSVTGYWQPLRSSARVILTFENKNISQRVIITYVHVAQCIKYLTKQVLWGIG
jgi:hypothetical protein